MAVPIGFPIKSLQHDAIIIKSSLRDGRTGVERGCDLEADKKAEGQ
jgi:hypothetical protein